MLLDKERKIIRIRASVEHLDPELYSKLTPGDELVIYYGSVTDAAQRASRFARLQAIVDVLELKRLACEQIDDAPTRTVWEIVYARGMSSAAAE